MILSVHQPQYLPWLGYFEKIAKSDAFVFLDNVQYKEREFQNRNKIRTTDGWMWLTVPVISKGMGRQKVSDEAIDDGRRWRKQHLMSLKTSYANAEFFDRYFGFFEAVYAKTWEKLSDLNIHIIQHLLEELSITTTVYFESKLDVTATKTERIVQLCKKLGAKSYLSGIGGKDYLDEAQFSDAGVALAYQEFIHPIYRQQYMLSGDDFLPYMCMLDLLFNEGPRSGDIIRMKQVSNAEVKL
jgi:hypothetical protein